MPEPTDTAPVIANPRPNVERRKVKERVMFVEIVTDELDRTLRFYTDALGFTLKVRENHAQADHRSQRISRTLD
jgi:hypothetical protein